MKNREVWERRVRSQAKVSLREKEGEELGAIQPWLTMVIGHESFRDLRRAWVREQREASISSGETAQVKEEETRESGKA